MRQIRARVGDDTGLDVDIDVAGNNDTKVVGRGKKSTRRSGREETEEWNEVVEEEEGKEEQEEE